MYNSRRKKLKKEKEEKESKKQAARESQWPSFLSGAAEDTGFIFELTS